MSPLLPAAVPDSASVGTSFYIGARRFTVRQNHAGQLIWVARDKRFGDVILLRTDTRRYAVAPWLEDAVPR